MDNPRLFASIVAACLAVPITAAAAEITLFEGPNFQGRSITFTTDDSNLDPTGFNDRASSIVVRDGVWEGCSDAYFQGGCAQFVPGEYPQLDGRLNHSISSLRVLQGGYRSQVYPEPRYYPRDAHPYDYYGRNRGSGYGYDNDGYYGYPYRDHGQ